MKLLVKLLSSSLAIMLAAYVLPGVFIESFWTAVLVALVIGVLNLFVKPILVLFSLPITILTLGLFMFVINTVVVLLAAYLVPGFDVDGFLTALLFSIITSIAGSFLYGFLS